MSDFDQSLYSAVMDELPEFGVSNASDSARHAWAECAHTAARIVAARQIERGEMNGFDQALYDAVMAERDPCYLFDPVQRGIERGYELGAQAAARLSAERAPADAKALYDLGKEHGLDERLRAPSPQQADDIIDMLIASSKSMGIQDWLDEQREAVRGFLAQFAPAQRAPVSDEELGRIIWDMRERNVASVMRTTPIPWFTCGLDNQREYAAYGAAVRAAIEASVPVIPERRPCPYCNGRPVVRYRTGHTMACPYCEGTGRDMDEHPIESAQEVADGTR